MSSAFDFIDKKVQNTIKGWESGEVEIPTYYSGRQYVSHNGNTYDKEAFEKAATKQQDWWTKTGSTHKNYGYDMTNPEDVKRASEGRYSVAYEASYGDDDYSQWLLKSGQASQGYFDKYYNEAYNDIMFERQQKANVRNFKRAVAREVWSTSDDPMNTEFTGDDVAAAAQRLQLTNPQYANIKISNPKAGYEQDFSDYTSPMLAQQEAEAKDVENRATSLYLDDALSYVEGMRSRQNRQLYLAEVEAKDREVEYKSIIDQAIADSGYSEEIDRRVGLAKDSTIDEWNANRELKRQAATNAVGAMQVAGASKYDIQLALNMDGRLSYIEDSEQGIEDESQRIARESELDVVASSILDNAGAGVQAAVAKATRVNSGEGKYMMGTALRDGFSPISMLELTPEEEDAVDDYISAVREELTRKYDPLGTSDAVQFEIDNTIRRSDLEQYLDEDEARANYLRYTLSEIGYEKDFIDEYVAKELSTEEGRAAVDKDMILSDYVESSTRDQVGNSISMVPVRAILSIATGAAGVVDMVRAPFAGTQEQWEVVDKLEEWSAITTAISHDRNHKALSEASDIASEVVRMYITAQMGTGLAASATKVSSTAKGTGFLFKFFNKNASRIPFVSGAIGNYYNEAKNNGATNAQARRYAVPAGLLEGYLESLEMGQVMRNTIGANFVGKKIAASGLSANFKQFVITKGMPFINFALDILGEGVEEGLSAIGSSIMRTSTWDEYHELNLSDVWENAKGGLILGAVMGGLSMPSHYQSYKYASRIYENTGDYSKYIDSLQSAVYMENMEETKRNVLINKAENGEVNVTREAAIEAEADIRNAEENIAAKKAAVEAAEEDAAIKIQNAQTKVDEISRRIATLRENNGKKKADKIKELTAQLNAAKKTLAQTESESQKKVATAKADYQAIAAKAKKATAKDQQAVDDYHAAKYVADIQAENTAVSAPVTVEPTTNTAAPTNTPENLINTVETGAVEAVEPVVAEVSPEMDFGAGGVAIDGTAMASEGVFKESRVSSNTLTKKFGDEAIKVFKDIDPDFGTYEVISEETSMRNAENWINEQGIDGVEYELLDEKRNWDSSDVDAAMMVITQQMSDGGDGNPDLVSRAMEAITLAEQLQSVGTEHGQVIQAFAKWTRTPAGMAVEAVKQVKKTQKKVLDKNAKKKKAVEADRKAVKEATKKATTEAAENTAKVITQKITTEKIVDPVQIIARKVVKAAQPRTAKERTFVEKMISDLFGVASASPITPVDNRADNTLSNVGEAYSNVSEYKRVWEEAEKAVIDLMGDSPEVVNALNAYRINSGRTIIPEATLKKAYDKAAEAIGLDMSKLIKQRSGNVEAMRDKLVNYLVTNTGVNEEGAVALAMEVNKIFNRESGKATVKYLNSMLGGKSTAKQAARTALEDIEGITNAGALIDIAYADVIEAKLDPKFRKMLRDTGYSIGDILAYGSGKEDMAMRVLLSDVQKANVSLEDLSTLVDMAMQTYREVVAEDKQAYLNRQFAERSQYAPEDALKTVTKLVNAGVLTNAEVADKVEAKLDTKFRKALKEQGIDIKSVILRGVESVEDAANAFIAQADSLNISNTEKQQIKDAMYNTFNEVVAEVKDKYAQTLINRYEAKQNPTEKQPPMDNIQKALYNAAMGVYSDKRIDDAILEANGLPVVTEEDITYIKANMEKALEARRVMEANGKDALYEGEKADYQIRRYQEEAAKVIASKMTVDGRVKFRDLQRVMMLLNSKTLIKNFSANVPTAILENVKDNPAALADILVSKVTGKRTTQGTTLAKIKAQAEGFKKGFTETAKDYKYGVNTSNANMLGRYSAFDDGESINRTTNAQPRIWGDKTVVGRAMNTLDKLLSAGMTFGDRPFFEAAAASRATELEALGYDVNTDEAQVDIVRYALDRVFQNNSDLAKGVSNIRNALNYFHVGDVGLGDLVLPFVQTPSNIADKLIDYSGVGGAARGIAQILGARKTGEFDQKLFVDRMGRAMTGSGVMFLGAALAKCGALVLGARDDEERQAMNNAGVKEFSITLDGETYHTVDWADPVANVLFIGGALGEMGFEGASIGQALGTITGVAVDSIFQMSVLQNAANLLAGSDSISENLINTAENFPTQFVQATINAVARTVDPYERETYSPERFQQMANKIMAKIPGLRERLPIKLNTAGQEIESYRGDTVGERLWQSFINPGYTTTVSDDVVHSELWRLRKEGGFDSQYLPKAYKSFDGIQLTTEEYQEYQRILGNATYSAALKVIESAEYKKAGDAEKADMLDKAISKAISSKEVKEFKQNIRDNN